MRRRTLEAIQLVCSEVLADGGDFGLASIGRLLEARGALKARVLYNVQSRDYRALIAAWGLFAGMERGEWGGPDEAGRAPGKIADPKTREIVRGLLEENEQLQRVVTQLLGIVAALAPDKNIPGGAERAGRPGPELP